MNIRSILIFSCLTFNLIACGSGPKNPPTPPIVESNTAPNAIISVNKTTYALGETITLNASQSSDIDQYPISYLWRVISPDGETLELADTTNENIAFEAQIKGEYKVSLTVTDSHGLSHSVNEQITVESNTEGTNQNPTAIISHTSIDYSIGDRVILSGKDSSDIDGNIAKYLWIVIDPQESLLVLNDNQEDQLNFIPQLAGDYQVELIVTDNAGLENTAQLTLNITTGIQIQAVITANDSVKHGDNVNLSAQNSTFNSNSKVKWELLSKPEGSQTTLSSTDTIDTHFIADKAGEYQIKLIIKDDEGNENSIQKTITATSVIQNGSPQAKITTSNNQISLNQTIELSGSESSDPENDTLTFFWTVASSPQGAEYVLEDENKEKALFSANKIGSYTLSLTVKDSELSNTTTIEITVKQGNRAPTASLLFISSNPKQGETFTFRGTGSDPDGDELTYKWTLLNKPENSNTSLASPENMNTDLYLDAEGEYLLSFQVFDQELSSEVLNQKIKVAQNQPPFISPFDYSNPTNGEVMTAVRFQTAGKDPEDMPITFSWKIYSQPEGSNAVLSSPESSETDFTTDMPGSYILTVDVNDGFQNSEYPWSYLIFIE